MQEKTSLILPCRILLPLQLSFISHVARYAPSSKQLQEQNNTTIQYKLILNTYLRPHRFYTIYIFQVLTFLSSRQWRFRQKFPQKEHDRPASHHEDANGRQREREAGRRA